MSKDTMLRVQASDRGMVDHGCVLDAAMKAAAAELDIVKEALRREAGIALRVGLSEVVLEGDKGRVSILYPKTVYKLDEARIGELYRLLGPRFHEFVVEKTTYVPTPDFESCFVSLPTSIRTASTGIIEAKPATPRVTFGKIVGA